MKLFRYIILVFVFLMAVLSGLFAFTAFPDGKDIYPLYRSVFFGEFNRKYAVMADSLAAMRYYTAIKKESEIDYLYMWIFKEDLEKKYGITIRIFSRDNFELTAQGLTGAAPDSFQMKLISATDGGISAEINKGKYFCAVALPFDERERIIAGYDRSRSPGVVIFEDKIPSKGYFAPEKRFIFLGGALFFSLILFALLLIDPEKKIKKIFIRGNDA